MVAGRVTDPFWIDPLEGVGVGEAPGARVIEVPPEVLRGVTRPADMDEQQWVEAIDSFMPKTDKAWGEFSFIFFFKTYLTAAASNDFADVHFELARIIQNPKCGKRVLALFPREHAKTTLITLGYVLWCICYRKKVNIVITSDAKHQAKEFLRNIKTELETNQKLIDDFGDLVPVTGKRYDEERASRGKWDETHIITRNQVQVKILSPGSQARGLNFNVITPDPNNPNRMITRPQRPDLIIFDDILNDKWIKNRLQRDKSEDWFFGPVFNALDSEKGDIIVIGTVIHHDDLLSRLMKDNDRTTSWTKLKRPACRVDSGGNIVEPLWPSRWSVSKLTQRRQEIGSLAFAREFLLNPVDEGSQFFQHGWFRFYMDESVPAEWVGHMKAEGIAELPQDLLCVTAIDPAISLKAVADYTVVMTVGFSPTRRAYYILEAFRQRCSPETQVVEMLRQAKAWDRKTQGGHGGYAHLGFVVEEYAYQASISYWLKKYMRDSNSWEFRIFPRKEHGVDKITRISGMSPMVEQNRLFFPVGMRRDLVTNQPLAYHPMSWLQDEMNDFPNGAFDDGVDSLQRAYSVLIREEHRYAMSGAYGARGKEGLEALTKTFSFMKSYLGL